MSLKRLACHVSVSASVSVLPVLSSPAHFFSFWCLVSISHVVCYGRILVFSICFTLVSSRFFSLLFRWVCQFFRLARGGVSISLIYCVFVSLSLVQSCLVWCHVRVLPCRSLAPILCPASDYDLQYLQTTVLVPQHDQISESCDPPP